MLRGDVQTLLADYKKLSDNKFWHYFLDELDKERIRIAIDNAAVEGLTFERTKFNQGKYSGFLLAKGMPDDLAANLKEELESEEANR